MRYVRDLSLAVFAGCVVGLIVVLSGAHVVAGLIAGAVVSGVLFIGAVWWERSRDRHRREPARPLAVPPNRWGNWEAYAEPYDEKGMVRLVIRSTNTERRLNFTCFVQNPDGDVSTAITPKRLKGRHERIYPKHFDPPVELQDGPYAVTWRHGDGEFVTDDHFTIKDGELG